MISIFARLSNGKLGSGLGLSIAKSAAELNDFELLLECTENMFIAKIRF